MEDKISNVASKMMIKLNSNIAYITNVFRGRYSFIAKLLSSNWVYDYNFTCTELEYIENGSNSLIITDKALNEEQLIAIQHFMLLNNFEVYAIRHRVNRTSLSVEVSEIFTASDVMKFEAPENNEWVVKNTIKEYLKGEIKYKYKAYKAYFSHDIRINDIVMGINKYIDVLSVTKCNNRHRTLFIIETTTLVFVLDMTNRVLTITEVYHDLDNHDKIRQVIKSANIDRNSIVPIVIV